MQLKLDLLPGSPWVLAIFMRSWLPFWKLLCLGEFTVVCSCLRLLLCRISLHFELSVAPFRLILVPGLWGPLTNSWAIGWIRLLLLILQYLSSLLLSYFCSVIFSSLCYCVIFFFGAAPGYHVLSDILTWVLSLGVLLFWSRPTSCFVLISS